MIPEITIKISFSEPGGERTDPTVTRVDVAPPALRPEQADEIPPVPSIDDSGEGGIPAPPVLADADENIPPLPTADEGGREEEEPAEPPPAPKPRRAR